MCKYEINSRVLSIKQYFILIWLKFICFLWLRNSQGQIYPYFPFESSSQRLAFLSCFTQSFRFSDVLWDKWMLVSCSVSFLFIAITVVVFSWPGYCDECVYVGCSRCCCCWKCFLFFILMAFILFRQPPPRKKGDCSIVQHSSIL